MTTTTRLSTRSTPMLFTRQRRLLQLLEALGGTSGMLDFQKLLFLYCQEAPTGEAHPWPRSATRLEYCDSRNVQKTWESQWLARTRSVSWCRNSTAFNRPRLAHFSFTRAISESIATRPLQDSCATSSRWRNGTLLNVPAGAKRPRPDRALRCRRRSRDRTGVAPRAYHDRPSIVPRPAKTSAARSGPTKSEQPRGHRRVSSAGGRPSWGAMASTTLPTSAWRSRRAPTGGGPKGRRRAA